MVLFKPGPPFDCISERQGFLYLRCHKAVSNRERRSRADGAGRLDARLAVSIGRKMPMPLAGVLERFLFMRNIWPL